MNTNIIRGAALAVVVALTAAPAISRAATAYDVNQAVHVNYNTSIAPFFGFGYPWSGRLQLTMTPDGIINGFYRPDGDQSFIPVTGGRNGENVWLDIGQTGRLHVTGTLQRGQIVGTAFDERTDDQYKFSATI